MKILDKRIREQEFIRNLWIATVEAGTTKKDVMEPDFWAYVAIKFKPYDRIEIRTDDSEWFGEFLITSCDRTFATLFELSYYKLGTKAVPSKHSLYEYKWGGPYGKHGIVRTSDSAMMVNKLDTKKEALDWLTQHEETIAHGNLPA